MTASLRRSWRALGRRELDFAFGLLELLASMRARDEAASREGGRDGVRAAAGVPVLPWRAAKDVELRASAGGFERPEDGGRTVVGSSARSHIPADD